jgi:hypothetical protein
MRPRPPWYFSDSMHPLSGYLIIRSAFLPQILGVLSVFRHNKLFSWCYRTSKRP